MNAETDRVIKIGQKMQALATAANLEATGHHADGLIESLDPTENKVIANELEQLNPAHRAPNVLFDTMRALQRRKSRMNISRLLKRH